MENSIYLFNDIYVKLMQKHYKAEILANDEIDFTEAEEHYLNIIYQAKNIKLTDFAIKAKVSKPAATQIINKFLKKKYVIKTVSETDKRVIYISLTKETNASFDRWSEKLNDLYGECISVLSKEEISTLKTILIKIYNNI